MRGQSGRRRLLVALGAASVGVSGCLRLTGTETEGSTEPGGTTESGDGSPTETTAGADELVPAFEYTPEEPVVGDVVQFDASSSTIPSGVDPSYDWMVSYGPDGVTRRFGTGESTTHRFASGGDFEAGVVVDAAGYEQDGSTTTITVTGDVSDVGGSLVLRWSDLLVPAETNEDETDDRSLAFGCRDLSIVAGDATVAAFDIGASPEPLLDDGVYGAETHPKGGSFRWFGGPRGWTRLVFPDTDLEAASELVMEGNIPPVDGQTVTVEVNGTRTDERTMTSQYGVRRFSLDA